MTPLKAASTLSLLFLSVVLFSPRSAQAFGGKRVAEGNVVADIHTNYWQEPKHFTSAVAVMVRGEAAAELRRFVAETRVATEVDGTKVYVGTNISCRKMMEKAGREYCYFTSLADVEYRFVKGNVSPYHYASDFDESADIKLGKIRVQDSTMKFGGKKWKQIKITGEVARYLDAVIKRRRSKGFSKSKNSYSCQSKDYCAFLVNSEGELRAY